MKHVNLPESPEVINQVAEDLVDGYRDAIVHKRKRNGFVRAVGTLLRDPHRALRVVMLLGRQVSEQLVEDLADDPSSTIIFHNSAGKTSPGEDALGEFLTALVHDKPSDAIDIFGHVLFHDDDLETASDFLSLLLATIVFDKAK